MFGDKDGYMFFYTWLPLFIKADCRPALVLDMHFSVWQKTRQGDRLV